MNRRQMLVFSAAVLSACTASRRNRSDLPSGLWYHETGYLAIGEFPEFGAGLFLFDYAAPRMVAIRQRDSASWEVGRALTFADAESERGENIVLSAGALRWGSRVFRQVAVRRLSLSAENRGIALHGELLFPAKRRARGTVLLVYGSGPASRRAFDPWSYWFLAQGFAVIAADKRGCGRSGGDWRLTSLPELADDARLLLAAARRNGARPPFVGWGASQAGWVLPQLGADRSLDGILMQAGATTTPARQIVANVEAELRAYGFAQADIDAAIAYYQTDLDVARGGRPYADIETAYRQAIEAKAEWILGPPALADAPERAMIRLMADFDPRPFWAANGVPTQAFFGTHDWVVPADENLAELRRAISPRCELETAVIANANHLMFESETGIRSEYASRSKIADGYFDGMARWLARYN